MTPSLSFDACADAGRAWRLQILVNNDRALNEMIAGAKERSWKHIQLDLGAYRNQNVVIRLYDLIPVPGYHAGNSYWKNLKLE